MIFNPSHLHRKCGLEKVKLFMTLCMSKLIQSIVLLALIPNISYFYFVREFQIKWLCANPIKYAQNHLCRNIFTNFQKHN